MSQWSIFEQIGTGLLVTIVGFIVARYWSHRRLYLVTRYYPRSALSSLGKAVSFTLLNRGHRAERDVTLELDPARKYELLAGSTEALVLVNNILRIPGLPAREDVSAIIQIDGGDFDNNNIVRFTSAEASGRIFKKLEDAPPPPGVAPAIVTVMFLLLGGVGYGAYDMGVDDGQSPAQATSVPVVPPLGPSTQEKGIISALRVRGWQNLDQFAQSPLAGLYSRGDFPVRATPVRRVGNFVILKVEIDNRGDDWLTVTASATSTQKPTPGTCEAQVSDNYFHDLIVPANSRKALLMMAYVPHAAKVNEQVIRFSVDLGYKEQTVYDIYRYIDVSALPVAHGVEVSCQYPKSQSPRLPQSK